MHLRAEPVGVQRRDVESAGARVARPDFDLRRAQRERDRDDAGARADVGDPRRLVADPLERRVDELLASSTRGEKTRPGSVTNVSPWKRVCISSSTT